MSSAPDALEEFDMFITRGRGAGVLLALVLAAAFAVLQLSGGTL